VRTALRRARRLGAFLLVVLAAGWALRRRSPVRWIEPAAVPGSEPPEPGPPGSLPADVLATDAGLTELPGELPAELPAEPPAAPAIEDDSAPAGTVTVDEAGVAELLASAPAGTDIDEAAYEQALADAASADAASADAASADAASADVGSAAGAAATADPLTPAPFAPEPVVPESPDSASAGAPAPAGPEDEELVDDEPATDTLEPADPLTPEPFTPEPVIADEPAPIGAGAPAPEPVGSDPVASQPAGETEVAGAGETEVASAVAQVVAAEPVEAAVGEDPAGDDEPTETQLVAPELGIDEPTMTIARDAIAAEDVEPRIPMPTFSEAPTMEIPAVTDDLRAVRGIGPSMERLLHGLGIISFRQLAMLDGVELERVRAELSDFRTRIEREDWVGQARDLHKEKYGRDPGSAG
jgi:predicted flap endonuclease-1-like 5' DNA nuclease